VMGMWDEELRIICVYQPARQVHLNIGLVHPIVTTINVVHLTNGFQGS